MNVLFVLAHNDDEYFGALRMREEIRLGNRVFVAYLTYGSIHGADPSARIKESMQVLAGLGVRDIEALMIGRDKNIFDFELHKKIVDAYQSLGKHFEGIAIERIYVMAWEGGHPDHDASHIVGVAFARKRNLQQQLYEFPAYSRFRVMHPLPGVTGILATATNRTDAFKTLASGFTYSTQRRTFLAMLPGSMLQLLVFGHQNYWPVPKQRDYTKPPHTGRLFYERRFNISFATFSKNISALPQYP